MELSLSDVRELIGGTEQKKCPVKVGQKIFVRTVTYHYTGEVKDISCYPYVQLKNAAWIADSGRFSDALKSCEFGEVEPYPDDIWLNFETATDVTQIKKLPLEQK